MGVGDSYEMEYESRKIALPKEAKRTESFRYPDIILIRMSMSTTASYVQMALNVAKR